VQFGGIVDLNEAGQSVSALPAHITNEPGSLRNLALEPGAGFSATITCETLLADSSGIVCALGFSTRR
ncbi:MAG: hypothetical protein ACE5GA_10925, partial [Candidatus Zixiibacteriota bacterium]